MSYSLFLNLCFSKTHLQKKNSFESKLSISDKSATKSQSLKHPEAKHNEVFHVTSNKRKPSSTKKIQRNFGIQLYSNVK